MNVAACQDSEASRAELARMRAPEPYYDDGQCTIYCGDSLDIIPCLRASSIDLIVTDPPYIIGAVSAGTLSSKSGTWGDMMNSSRWFSDWYGMSQRVLVQSGALWTFCNWRSLPVVMKAAIDCKWAVTSTLVWHKDWIGPGGANGLRPAYELVALLAMPEFSIPNRSIPDVWTQKWASFKPTGHPAEKPVPLLSRIIQVSGLSRESLILDPFMGSGSTLRAARDLGYRAIGVETEDRYCEIAVKRLRQAVLPLGEQP